MQINIFDSRPHHIDKLELRLIHRLNQVTEDIFLEGISAGNIRGITREIGSGIDKK